VEEIAFGGLFDIRKHVFHRHPIYVHPNHIAFCRPQPHGYRLEGHTRKSGVLVVGDDECVLQVIAALTSPLSVRSPGPKIFPFPLLPTPTTCYRCKWTDLPDEIY
jgi:hypothetical protein